MQPSLDRREPQASVDALALFGRVLIGTIFLISVYGKLTAPSGTIAFIAAAGLPLPTLAYLAAVAIELLGGIALMAGFQTRLAAAALAIFCIAAALGFHRAWADQSQFMHFFKNVAMTGGLLQVVASGAGAFSVDARRRGQRP